MPGIHRHSLDHLIRHLDEVVPLGIRAVALFPVLGDERKDRTASESVREDGLMQNSIRELKERFPELLVITDVAMDPYSSDGHDGIVSPDGRILNDETVAVLCKQAVCQANAGADIISPSDMMDGRVGALREALDAAGHQEVSILAYTAKYASAFYGPFRDAVDSNFKGTRDSYQMDPANGREALAESLEDDSLL